MVRVGGETSLRRTMRRTDATLEWPDHSYMYGTERERERRGITHGDARAAHPCSMFHQSRRRRPRRRRPRPY